MSRYLLPAAFFAMTAWVSWYNAGHADSKILVPLVDVVFPAAAGDPAQLGVRSVQVLAAVGTVLLVLAVIEHLRALRRQPRDSGT